MGAQQTAEEVFDSLTGFDEMAIAQHFGHTVAELGGSNQSMFGRALVFVAKRRDGMSDDDARTAALSLPMKELTSFFADSSDEEAGKDEEPEQQPESLPSSAS